MRCAATLAALLLLPACKREPPARAPPPPAAAAPSAAPVLAPHPIYAPAPDWGEPDAAKVRQLFEARAAEVRRCYEAELQRHPKASGKLTLRLTIVESGALRYVTVARSTFRRPDVPSCVVAVVRRWKTPFHPDDPVEVEYPLSFSPR